MSEYKLEDNFKADETRIQVSQHQTEKGLTVTFNVHTNKACSLHWGLRKPRTKQWQSPPDEYWPPDTVRFNDQAVQSPMVTGKDGMQTLQLQIEIPSPWNILPFVLYFPEDRRWVKNGHQDFSVTLPGQEPDRQAEEVLAACIEGDAWQRHRFDLGEGEILAAGVLETDDRVSLRLACDIPPPLILHWGLTGRYRFDWTQPPSASWPAGTNAIDDKAVQTPFLNRDGLSCLEIDFNKTDAGEVLRGLNFVLFQPESGQWLKAGHKNMYLPLSMDAESAGERSFGSRQANALADEIIDAEMGRNSWTLMHRFNLCHDLLDRAHNDPQALALLFTWLRYSAIRQLDWQRHYNTQPRELSHAQDRLTKHIANRYIAQRESRSWLRLMLTTLGPGGEGQKVRDEILNIMHRHKLKEVHGTFMEEWHQKLHNNTTPDDIVICEAYLAFLHSNGDLQQFYGTLEQRGVTRERLGSFERPIRQDPIFHGDKKEGLIGDFNHFLAILRSVHSGTDIATASARGIIGDSLNQALDHLLTLHGQGAPAQAQAETITGIRKAVTDRIRNEKDELAVRDLLYLDLALESTLRACIEQQALSHADQGLLSNLVNTTLHNLALSVDAEEFPLLARQLDTLITQQDVGVDWALRMKSLTDRLGRAIGEWSNELYADLQPLAESLGAAFEAEPWTIPLFSEEIIRGSPAFMLSLLLRRLDPLLRTQAGLGGWQVISPGQANGQVRVVDKLLTVQGDTYTEPTVIVTDTVSGDEEIPGGVTSVITTDTPDLVSHVAVRARNAHVLFATCYETEAYEQLKARQGQQLVLQVNSAGDVVFEASSGSQPGVIPLKDKQALHLKPRRFSSWAVTANAFTDELAGGKSNNLNALHKLLPAWIHFPASMALPFGVFEKTLDTTENQALRERYEALLLQLPEDPDKHLPRIRELLLDLQAPDPLRHALSAAWQATALPPVEPGQLWGTINRVWASKWNDRAYYSRVANTIPHQDLSIAVLIQQVVEADYAFVIHTVNPLNGSDDEIFAEVVLGMGETLVGNYPGRAFGFICTKQDLQCSTLSYPSKSRGLYGHGVIFRSDSNGEDLEEFAGAGLYDSYLAEAPQKRLLDYTEEPLVQDTQFRQRMMRDIAKIGLEVEQACGTPQDIEGAIQQGKYYVVQTRPQVGL